MAQVSHKGSSCLAPTLSLALARRAGPGSTFFLLFLVLAQTHWGRILDKSWGKNSSVAWPFVILSQSLFSLPPLASLWFIMGQS